MRKTAGILAALAIAASAFVAAPANAAPVTITTGGSSFAAGLFQTCATNYASTATVNYTSSSSGTGRTNFVNGTYDFAGTDSTFGANDPKPASTYAYVAVAGGPIALIFHINNTTTVKGKTKVTPVSSLKLDADTVGQIWLGTITKWNDPAITALNPGLTLPDEAIVPAYRNSKSGTNGNFSGYLAANKVSGWVADQTWTNATKSSTPAGTGYSTSALLVSGVKATEGSIGYVDLKDATGSGLKMVALKNVAGQFLLPTAAAAAKFLQFGSVADNGFVTLDWNKSVVGGYNASVITYALVNTGTATANGANVKDFITYVLNTCVPANASKLGYVALSGAVLKKAKAVAATIK